MFGDLGAFLDAEELSAFDVFTYSFGDYERLYLRGQFTAHRNTPRINTLYTACPFLGAGLLQELQLKRALLERAKTHPTERLAQRFNSAEGCYSAVVATAEGVSLKFAIKGLADFTAGQEVHLVHGAIRVCNHTGEGGSDSAHGGPGVALPCDPRLAPMRPHSEALQGNQRSVGPRIPVVLHSDCSKWIDAQYRLCANISGWDKDNDWSLYRVGGLWYRQRFVNSYPRGVLEGAFFHFQVWKQTYKKLTYGSPDMPTLDASSGFALTPRRFLPAPGHVPAVPAHVPVVPGQVPALRGHVPAVPGHVPADSPQAHTLGARPPKLREQASALARMELEVERQLAVLDAV